mmetsp:Transcript_19429/g.54041  ORF Transcript_19429/g.54041 Transcript_19429/m.54041 type:complete len:108 (-) Transcript_19429:566-889(-)
MSSHQMCAQSTSRMWSRTFLPQCQRAHVGFYNAVGAGLALEQVGSSDVRLSPCIVECQLLAHAVGSTCRHANKGEMATRVDRAITTACREEKRNEMKKGTLGRSREQ